MSKHERGARKHKFCGVAAKKPCGDCKESKNYIDICEPASWGSGYSYLKKVVVKGKARYDKKVYEAHHIVCVSQVNQVLLANSKIKDAIAQSVWCINNKLNMIAMPMWGHTVKWYCDIDADDYGTSKPLSVIKDELKKPPFKNLPQHDWDHPAYSQEIEEHCMSIANQVEEAAHELKGKALEENLNTLSKMYDKELRARGSTRNGGTHAAWKMGMKQQAGWGLPFSMAPAYDATEVSFPVRNFNQKLKDWINFIAAGIGGG